MEEISRTILEKEVNLRLDHYLVQSLDGPSRSQIQLWIKQGYCQVNGNLKKANYKLCLGDQINLQIPDPVEIELVPENIPLDILYEDDQLLVVNKPKGMVVHPAPGHPSGTLVNAIMYHCKGELSGINGEIRPGIVHRIDRNTTGSLIVCKTDQAHQCIAQQIKEHSIHRVYRAIVYGSFHPSDGVIETTIGRDPKDRKKMSANVSVGKRAVTHYHQIRKLKNQFSYMEFELETGRTHQIRVHMAYKGHPILGDDVYGPKRCPFPLQGQTLHAMTIGFVHPISKKYLEINAPLPDYFKNLLDRLDLDS